MGAEGDAVCSTLSGSLGGQRWLMGGWLLQLAPAPSIICRKRPAMCLPA
jgi:hypothetical protein